MWDNVPKKGQLALKELLLALNEINLFFSNFCSVKEKGPQGSLRTQCWERVRSFQLPREVNSGEWFYQESHVPSCACSPAGDRQSFSHVYRIIIFYASGMYPLIKECHLNWGFASLHMAGKAVRPRKSRCSMTAARKDPSLSFWGPVQQINRSRNRI